MLRRILISLVGAGALVWGVVVVTKPPRPPTVVGAVVARPPPAVACANAGFCTSTIAKSRPAVARPKLAVAAFEEHSVVARVIDGDTIELASGEKVRYIGINAPEIVNPRRSEQCFGQVAAQFNRELVEGKSVRLVKDVSETDKYGRLLRYVFLSDGVFVNLKLVQEGLAEADTWPPDVKYAAQFVTAARQARAEKRGLWSGCK